MLRIEAGSGGVFCDRVSRRQFLRVGGLAMGGIALPELLRAERAAGIRGSHRAIIMIYLPGGPSHTDLFDLKPDAPPDIRGEFKPIATNVDGIRICEHLPKLARMMDRVTVVRSLTGARDEHDSHLCVTGYTSVEARMNDAPDMGSVVSRLQGPVQRNVPPYVNMAPHSVHREYDNPGPGFLGLSAGPLNPNGPLMADMTLKGVSLTRLEHRRQLLAGLDRFRRESDALTGIDGLHREAFDLLSSTKLANALDVTREDPKVRERYGKGVQNPVGDAAPMQNEQFLLARRLVEAGARVVTVSYGFWDWHGGNFANLKTYLPHFDQALTALLTDLRERGLEQDVSVVVWGEFGRTPHINKDAGRDHWARVSSCLLAGGGMRTGQVIGSTTRFGDEADERPVDYKDVFATLYHNLGIDIATTPVMDAENRPHYLFDGYQPIPELVG